MHEIFQERACCPTSTASDIWYAVNCQYETKPEFCHVCKIPKEGHEIGAIPVLFDMAPVRMEFGLCVDSIVPATQATTARDYVCSECKGELEIRKTTLKADGGRYNISAYFAHRRKSSTCTGASGESLEHLRSKYVLQKFLGHYDFCIECCETCDDSLGFMTKKSDKLALEQRVVLDEKLFVYDVMIRRGSGGVAVEVLHTHKTEEPKIETSKKNGLFVVEVSSCDVLQAVPRLEQALVKGNSVTLRNLLKKTHVCAECQTLLLYGEWEHDPFEHWVQTSCALEREYLRHLTAITLAAVCELKRKVNALRLCGLKRKAFEKARLLSENFEEEKTRRKREVFVKGVSFKCCACGAWEHKKHNVHRKKFTEYEYQQLQKWWLRNGLPLPDHVEACDLCTTSCVGCGQYYLLENACKYGLCRECNLASHYQ